MDDKIKTSWHSAFHPNPLVYKESLYVPNSPDWGFSWMLLGQVHFHMSVIVCDCLCVCVPQCPSCLSCSTLPCSSAWKSMRCWRHSSAAHDERSLHIAKQSFWTSGSLQVTPPLPSLGKTALTTARHFLPQSVVEEAADLSSHLLMRLRFPAAAAPETWNILEP